MNIQKIWQSLSILDLSYMHLINDVMNHFAQEIIDGEGFYNNGPSNMSAKQTIATLQKALDDKQIEAFENCALEFCITNEYIIQGKSWNCIKYWLNNHKNQFKDSEIKYLKALNKSYASIYKVISITPNQSIELQNMIETDQSSINISHKTIGKKVKEKSFIVTRLLQQKNKAGNMGYQLSNTLLYLPDDIAQGSVKVIETMMQAMNSPLIRPELEFDTPNDRLMQKKLWIKEILEQWYMYYSSKLKRTLEEPVFH